MSYDVVLWLPLVLAGVLAGLFCLRGRRPLLAAAINGLIAASFVTKVFWASQHGKGWVSAYGWGSAAVYPAPTGVMFEHIAVDGIVNRALWCGQLLPFSLPPLALCLWGAATAAYRRRARWSLLIPLFAGAPNLVLVLWLVQAARVRSPSDLGWALDYVREWQRAGARVETGGGVCVGFIQCQEDLARRFPAAEVARARADCQRVCANAVATGHFNPGMLESLCRRLTP